MIEGQGGRVAVPLARSIKGGVMIIIGTAERYGEHYELVRFYQRGGSDIVGRYMTLNEARDYCANIESSSSTATSAEATARTAERGPWFIGYREA